MRFILFGFLVFPPFLILAQNPAKPNDTIGFPCTAKVIGTDTIPVIYIGEVYVWGNKSERNSAEARQWDRLVRNVKKAYPYAKIAGEKFNEFNQKIAGIQSKSVQKALMKQAEDELQAQFGTELKELTITQGKILLKLIDRQTSNSSYDIVKDFRGNFRAFFYQSFARMFGYNLKVKYDPMGEDADIERIVILIENGII
ncbi:MAG: DUF4294 domain-containing protein [Bacteroidales bacterium]